MPRRLRVAFFVHTMRSDWNNGNAHFLRGLARAMGSGLPQDAAAQPTAAQAGGTVPPQGHQVTVFEQEESWSMQGLLTERRGAASVEQFARVYPDVDVVAVPEGALLRARLAEQDVVIVHEW
ncbi:MAG TPA: hypothetical protein VGD62_00605, partial [Acidobacteriaceae bacterium]